MTEEFAIRIKTIMENQAIKSVVTPLKNMAKEGEASAESIAKIGKTALKLGSVIAIFALFVNGIKTFIMYNDETQKKIQKLSTSTNTLKANWMSLSYTIGSFFSNVINWILDGLNKIVSFLAKIIAYINYFLTAIGLGGKNASFFASKMGESAKNAKALNKQLAGFDELNNLSKESGGGSGSGSGGFPTNEIPISDRFKEIVEKIQAHMDWLGVIMSSSALALGGLLFFGGHHALGLGLIALGATGIANAISVNWNSAETQLGTALQRIMLLLGGSLLAIGAILLMTGDIPLGLGFIVAGAGSMVSAVKVDWDSVAVKYFEPFINKMAEIAEDIINGFIRPIVDFFKGIGSWIKKNIFDPFVKWFKKLFGISSPSKVMKELGGYIVEGFKNGISNVWDAVKGIWNGLKEKISDVFNGIKNLASKGWEGVKSAWNSVGSWFSNSVGTPIKNALSNAWDNVKTGAQNGWNNVKNAFNSVGSWFNNNVKGPIASRFKELFEDKGNDSVFAKATKGYTNLISGFANVGSYFKTNVVDVINNKLNGINSTRDIKVRLGLPAFGQIWDIISGYKGEIGVTVNIPDVRTSWGTVSGGKASGYVGTKPYYGKAVMVEYAVGTNYVPNDQMAMLHKGEAVIPAEFNNQQGSPYIHNDETNQLIRDFMHIVQSKEFRATISQREVGQASVDYINQQSRIMGGSLV